VEGKSGGGFKVLLNEYVGVLENSLSYFGVLEELRVCLGGSVILMHSLIEIVSLALREFHLFKLIYILKCIAS
jgi:hypothetical protein